MNGTDVGPFSGLYAAAVAKRAGLTGRVVATEPNLGNITHLRRHIGLNRLQGRITAIHSVASDFDGSVQFLASGTSEARICGASQSGAVKVPCRTLDSLEGTATDLLKIDVEGFEVRTLDGMRISSINSYESLVALSHDGRAPEGAL